MEQPKNELKACDTIYSLKSWFENIGKYETLGKCICVILGLGSLLPN